MKKSIVKTNTVRVPLHNAIIYDALLLNGPSDIVTIIQQVGFPIAAALGLGWFIYRLIMRIVDGMENKLDVVDEKVAEQISAMEQRLGTKLDSQHGILVALIDRVRSLDNEIIRQDTMIKTMLGVPQLIDTNKIAKADRDDQRKD